VAVVTIPSGILARCGPGREGNSTDESSILGIRAAIGHLFVIVVTEEDHSVHPFVVNWAPTNVILFFGIDVSAVRGYVNLSLLQKRP